MGTYSSKILGCPVMCLNMKIGTRQDDVKTRQDKISTLVPSLELQLRDEVG